MLRFFADDGEWIHVAVEGNGPPVVFLHGWTSSHREWLPFARELADLMTGYCWDARGHGGHRLHAPAAPTVERMARDLANLMAHFRLRKPVLVGHSMGALTLWEYIRRFGCGAIGKLCLVDQSPRLVTREDWDLGIYGAFSVDHNTGFIEKMRTDFPEAVLQLAAYGNNSRARAAYEKNSKGFQRAREALKELDPVPLIALWESLSRQDYRDVLPAIGVPVLLIYGAESNFYGLETARYVTRMIPGAELHIYEGADHSPHVWQRERFLRDLRRFALGRAENSGK
ncbi:MAG: alpha/beta hydrolase [Betaproteobacteria bacterium]|nr:alpha/beta hydrolase [Betaproteobacteria bacterium]